MYRNIIHMRQKASSTLSLVKNSVLIDLCDTSQSIHSIEELVGMITRDFSCSWSSITKAGCFPSLPISVFKKNGIPPIPC